MLNYICNLPQTKWLSVYRESIKKIFFFNGNFTTVNSFRKMHFSWILGKCWAILIEIGYRCSKHKKHNPLDPKYTPSKKKRKSLVLFLPFLQLLTTPWLGACDKFGIRHRKKGTKRTKFGERGVIQVYYVIFFYVYYL